LGGSATGAAYGLHPSVGSVRAEPNLRPSLELRRDMNFRSLGFTGVSVLLFSACMVEAGDDDPEGGGDSSPGLSEGGAPPGAGDGDAADDSPASLGKGEIATGTG